MALASSPVSAQPKPAPPSESASPQECVDAAVASVQARYHEMRDLAADFRQVTRSVAFGTGSTPSASSGKVQFAKPGKMRWTYLEPEPSLVVSNGETLWLYDPAKREVQRLAMGSGYFSAAGIHFLLGEGDIARDFQVTAESCDETGFALELLPKEPAQYEKLRITGDPATGDLLQTSIVDLFGNLTVIDFSAIEVDTDLPASTFEFEVPAGVEVIDLDAGGAALRAPTIPSQWRAVAQSGNSTSGTASGLLAGFPQSVGQRTAEPRRYRQNVGSEGAGSHLEAAPRAQAAAPSADFAAASAAGPSRCAPSERRGDVGNASALGLPDTLAALGPPTVDTQRPSDRLKMTKIRGNPASSAFLAIPLQGVQARARSLGPGSTSRPTDRVGSATMGQEKEIPLTVREVFLPTRTELRTNSGRSQASAGRNPRLVRPGVAGVFRSSHQRGMGFALDPGAAHDRVRSQSEETEA